MNVRSSIAAAAGLLLAACSMTHSTLIDAGGDYAPDGVGRNAGRGMLHAVRHDHHGGHKEVAPVRCQSDLGAYYLSRSLLAVKLEQIAPSIEEDTDKAGQPRFDRRSRDYSPPRSGLYRLSVTATVVADTGKGYCLDYLASPTSNDTINVTRTEDALLVEVSALADDQSLRIAKKLIDIIFIGISGNPNYRNELNARGNGNEAFEIKTLVEATYDPTVPMQAALLNERLKDFGHCLILGEHVPEKKLDFTRYCDDPVGYLKRHGVDRHSFQEDRPKAKAAQEIPGIYYRPRRPFSYYVMTQQDRKIAGSWKLSNTATVRLENDSPILVVGVDRNLFAKRRTRLTFDQGVLKHVALDKTSELLAFVDVPLYFAEGLVALPAAMIRVDFDQTVAETNLLGAELQLIAERERIRSVNQKTRELLEKNTLKGGG